MSSLTVMVSNRLPVSVTKVDGKLVFGKSDGGLAKGLESYTKGRRSIWVGWPGIAADELTKLDKKAIIAELKKDNLVPVFMSKKQVDGFYSGYSNSVLWPLFHNLPLDMSDAKKYWKYYKEVNELFAEAVAAVAKPSSMVWVHDYHFLLLPELLRWMLHKDSTVGFFSHIPFPSYQTLKALPQAKPLLRGMLGASLVGFHTTSYGDQFMDCCNKLNIGTAENNQVIMGSRTVKIADFPIGIDYNKFAGANKSKAVRAEVLKLQHKYRKYKLILTVDRLDPSKGFVERLEAFFEFLYINPQLHRKVKMVMLTIPSRTDVKAYKDLKERIDQLVAMINDTYGTPSWQPIDFMYKSIPFEELSALYQVADVAFVVPIRDGMNMVAKEYIASKQQRDGVLILSETAGAAQELTDAVLVNPKRQTSIVSGLTKALNMQHTPVTKRLKNMQKKLSTNTIHTWAKGFMDSMEVNNKITPHRTRHLGVSQQRKLLRAFGAAKQRLLLFDYDGTLVNFNADPLKTPLLRGVRDSLMALGAHKNTRLVVISGRATHELDTYTKGLSNDAAGEHGAFIKKNGTWVTTVAKNTGWQGHILPLLEAYAQKTPGARVEVKKHALVWHYRESPAYLAKKNLAILKRVLRPELHLFKLKAHDGKKVLEIKPPSVNKGAAAKNWINKQSDFVMVIGDDYTDEDMFKVAPKDAWTIKVGPGITAANYRLKNVAAVHALLKVLAD